MGEGNAFYHNKTAAQQQETPTVQYTGFYWGNAIQVTEQENTKVSYSLSMVDFEFFSCSLISVAHNVPMNSWLINVTADINHDYESPKLFVQ